MLGWRFSNTIKRRMMPYVMPMTQNCTDISSEYFARPSASLSSDLDFVHLFSDETFEADERKTRRSLVADDRESDRDTEMHSDRYGKISKKDTSQGFMQLLNSGSIDGSFTGMFLYFQQITGISSIILQVLHSCL